MHGRPFRLLCPTHVLLPPQVVADFAADGCIYLELRTTPKVPGGEEGGAALIQS